MVEEFCACSSTAEALAVERTQANSPIAADRDDRVNMALIPDTDSGEISGYLRSALSSVHGGGKDDSTVLRTRNLPVGSGYADCWEFDRTSRCQSFRVIPCAPPMLRIVINRA